MKAKPNSELGRSLMAFTGGAAGAFALLFITAGLREASDRTMLASTAARGNGDEAYSEALEQLDEVLAAERGDPAVCEWFLIEAQELAKDWTNGSNLVKLVTGSLIVGAQSKANAEALNSSAQEHLASLEAILQYYGLIDGVNQVASEAEEFTAADDDRTIGERALEGFPGERSLDDVLRRLDQLTKDDSERAALIEEIVGWLFEEMEVDDALRHFNQLDSFWWKERIAGEFLDQMVAKDVTVALGNLDAIPCWLLSVGGGDFDALLEGAVSEVNQEWALEQLLGANLHGGVGLEVCLRLVQQQTRAGELEFSVDALRQIRGEFKFHEKMAFGYAPPELIEAIAKTDPVQAMRVAREFEGIGHTIAFRELARSDLPMAFREYVRTREEKQHGFPRWTALDGIMGSVDLASAEDYISINNANLEDFGRFGNSKVVMNVSKVDLPLAKSLVLELSPDQGRAEALKLMTPALVDAGPVEGIEWILATQETTVERANGVGSMVAVWGSRDLNAAQRWLSEAALEVEVRNQADKRFVDQALIQANIEMAASAYLGIESPGARESVMQHVARRNVGQNFKQFLDILEANGVTNLPKGR